MQRIVGVVAIVVCTLVGCEPTTEPVRTPTLDFTFGVHRLAVEPPFLVESTGDALVVRGTYETLTSGYTAEASASLTAGVLELRVVGTQPESNHPVVTPTGYEARIHGASRPPNRLRIVHEYRGINRAPTVVFEQELSLQ